MDEDQVRVRFILFLFWLALYTVASASALRAAAW